MTGFRSFSFYTFGAAAMCLAYAAAPAAAQDAAEETETVSDPIAELLVESESAPVEEETEDGEVSTAGEAVSPDGTVSVNADEEAPVTAPEESFTGAPPMWVVSDADSTYWLFGTFHILPPSLEWRTAALEHALDEAETYYFEVEGDSADAQSRTLQILMLQGFNPSGVTLTGMLDEADAKKLAEISTELSLPMAAVDPMRPWQAFLALSVQFIITQGFEPGAGADTVLMAEARGRGKELKFFETIEQQLGFFTGLSSETEKSLLVLTLRNWEKQKTDFEELFTAWRDGDIEVIDQNMNDTMREDAPEVFETLIVKRNEAWADVIATDMLNGSTDGLVAVGAAHMAGGEFSLPALLKSRGFKVERFSDASLAETSSNEAANDNEEVDEP